jgi:DinB superfamily
MTKPLEPHEVVASLQSTPAVLRTLLDPRPSDMFTWHPAPGKWCINEVVGHLIEADRHDFIGRIRLILDHEEPRLAVSDQAEVARMRHDCDHALHDLLDELSQQRSGSLSFIVKFGDEELQRGGVHPTIGRLQIGNLLHEWVYHDMNHVRQILVNVQGFLWEHLGHMQRFYQP